jgi:hypothetical protein
LNPWNTRKKFRVSKPKVRLKQLEYQKQRRNHKPGHPKAGCEAFRAAECVLKPANGFWRNFLVEC